MPVNSGAHGEDEAPSSESRRSDHLPLETTDDAEVA